MALQTFTAGQVLTAAQLTALQTNDYNQTVSAKTANYTLVAADKGTRITMSSATDTTVTVNTSLFAAGDSLRIQNLNGGGLCTITAGTATVTSAGSLTLPSWGGGQLFFSSASAAVWFPDAINPGLVFIKAQTIGAAVGSVTVSSAFSSAYENYLITVNGGVASADTALGLQLGSTTTGYYAAASRVNFAGSAFTAADSNAAAFTFAGLISTNALNLNAVLQSPNLAKATVINSSAVLPKSTGYGQACNGVLENTTQYTAFTLTPASGTITGGIIRVYGYLNS